MKFFRSLVVNAVFFLNVLLLFLVLFRNSLEVPAWLHAVGRMHPLMLHVPIGLLIMAGLMMLFRSGFKKKSFQNFLNFTLYFSAITSVVTAIMGLLLSTEEGYDPIQLQRHLIAGVAVSILSWWLLWLGRFGEDRRKLFTASLILTTAVLLTAGHLGSVLTHGENFILQPLGSDSPEVEPITDSTALYVAAIEPILRSKCMSCHNEKKAKGKLIMTSVEYILKGGKHGPAWVAGEPEKSNLLKRVQLPEDNDDHMPPAGKPQLSENEIDLVELWIRKGADVTTAWTKFKTGDSLKNLAEQSIQRQQKASAVHYTFAFASQETINELNTPSRTVSQYALSEPALMADFYLAQSFTSSKLEELLKVKEQVVSLNLSRMPVADADGKLIGQFTNLEKLNLNQTPVSGTILSSFKGLSKLQSISLAGTAVDKASLSMISNLPALTQVFLWNTKVQAADIGTLQKDFPKINWDIGFQPHEILRLTPPILVNENFILGDEEPIVLKHNLPGAIIRYSLDGTDPDSVKGMLYEKPVFISKYSHLKTRSYKEGWYGSPSSEYIFFHKGLHPLRAELTYPPNKDYKGEGAATLINDKKGSADNFKDIAWIAFREKPFECLFELDPATPVNHLTISYAENFGAYVLPPASIEVYAGDDERQLKLVKREIPVQPTAYGSVLVKGIELTIPPARFYKLIVNPVAKVPAWITKKSEKGWFFVDEVIFN